MFFLFAQVWSFLLPSECFCDSFTFFFWVRQNKSMFFLRGAPARLRSGLRRLHQFCGPLALQFQCWNAPENRPSPKDILSSNHCFSGSVLVSGRLLKSIFALHRGRVHLWEIEKLNHPAKNDDSRLLRCQQSRVDTQTFGHQEQKSQSQVKLGGINE